MRNYDNVPSFNNFVDDPVQYSELKAFWKGSIEKIVGYAGSEYIYNYYSNGKEILDGNPIYNLLLKNNRGIRIIQFEAESNGPLLSAWLNTLEINEKRIEELVISLQLNNDTFSDARALIQLFANTVLSHSILQGINEMYDASWNLEKLSDAVQATSYDQIFPEFMNLFEPSLESKKFKLATFKEFYNNYHLISWDTIRFTNKSPLSSSYNNFVKYISLINNLVSFDESMDFETLRKKDTLLFMIQKNWGTHQYITKLHSYTLEAEKEYEYLKDNFQIADK